MESRTNPLWVLAFDASCGRCREIAKAVEKAAGTKVEIRSLAHIEVRQWREQALGADAPLAPTLFRVRAGQVAAWTGPAMGLRLFGRLGPRATVRLMSSLGELNARIRGEAAAPAEPNTVNRQGFLRLGTGAAIALGLALTGKAPALAASDEGNKVLAWVEANKHRLPKTYDEFVSYSLPYRRAIYAELSPKVRSQLWTTRMDRIRKVRTNLTPAQQRVLSEIRVFAADESTFAQDISAIRDRAEALKNKAIEAFGREQTRVLFTSLGPTQNSDPVTPMATCECATEDDWCGIPDCYDTNCREYVGCGFLNVYLCDGECD